MLIRLDWCDVFEGNFPKRIKKLKREGHKIFFDINIYDIPHIMEMGFEAMKRVGIDYVSCIENERKVLKNL